MSRLVRAAAVLVLWSGVLFGGWRWISAIEQGESLIESEPRTVAEHAKGPDATRVSARLVSFEIQAGQRATFELCFLAPPPRETLTGAFDVVVFGLKPMRLLLRVPLDEAHLDLLNRSEDAACLPLGGGVIEQPGAHSIDLVWPHQPPPSRVQATQVWARALVRRELPAAGWFAIAGTGFLVLLVFGWWGRSFGQVSAPDKTGWHKSLAAAVVLLGAVYVLLQIPTVGSRMGFAKGMGVAALQVLMLWGALRWVEGARAPFERISLRLPDHLGLSIVLSLAGGVVLSVVARVALRAVPSTGVAPIETFISWPSGTLALALVGALAPFAEELFFRGYLYAIFRRWGEFAALALSTLAFTGFHLAQSWGNWGGVVAIALAGIGFGLARYWSASVWVAALVHVVYNLTLSFSSFFGVSLW